MSYTQNFLGAAYPIHSLTEKLTEKKPPTGVDLYSRFALAGALCWYVAVVPNPAPSPTVP